MNVVTLMGRTTADIEVKMTPSNKSVAKFNLAVPSNFKRDETNFITIVAWGKTAELLGTHVKKGQQIAIVGELTARNYEDKQGNKRTAYEVVASSFYFCGSKSDNSQNATASYIPEAYTKPTYEEIKQDDDLPF